MRERSRRDVCCFSRPGSAGVTQLKRQFQLRSLTREHSFSFLDFTSVNSFQEEVKFSSASFYNLLPLPPPTTRPPTHDVQNFSTPSKGTTGPTETYYAATDIVKVCNMFLLVSDK